MLVAEFVSGKVGFSVSLSSRLDSCAARNFDFRVIRCLTIFNSKVLSSVTDSVPEIGSVPIESSREEDSWACSASNPEGENVLLSGNSGDSPLLLARIIILAPKVDVGLSASSSDRKVLSGTFGALGNDVESVSLSSNRFEFPIGNISVMSDSRVLEVLFVVAAELLEHELSSAVVLAERLDPAALGNFNRLGGLVLFDLPLLVEVGTGGSQVGSLPALSSAHEEVFATDVLSDVSDRVSAVLAVDGLHEEVLFAIIVVSEPVVQPRVALVAGGKEGSLAARHVLDGVDRFLSGDRSELELGGLGLFGRFEVQKDVAVSVLNGERLSIGSSDRLDHVEAFEVGLNWSVGIVLLYIEELLNVVLGGPKFNSVPVSSS